MARRGGKKNKGRGWSFSITSIFAIFYALFKFDVINQVYQVMMQKTTIISGLTSIFSNFSKNWVDVVMNIIKLKFMAKILSFIGMSSIGKIGKFHLRW